MIRFLLMTICFSVIYSCSSSKVLRLYPEQPLPASETARLYGFTKGGYVDTSHDCFLQLKIIEFDGRSLGNSFHILEILPGPHIISVVFKPFDRWGSKWYPKSHLTIKFNASAEGEYVFDCTFDRSGEWGVWIIDKHTGYIVND